jgi:formylmethanofuran dehydrogenase subunit E
MDEDNIEVEKIETKVAMKSKTDLGESSWSGICRKCGDLVKQEPLNDKHYCKKCLG